MASGGHASSGPPPDPNSLKTAKRGLSFTALPAAGHDGDVPEFPLPRVPVYDIWFVGKERHKELDVEGTAARYDRELEVWAWAWRTPQAAAWAKEPWRSDSVAMWVRTRVICESADATAADKGSLHRFADQIGLTPAGLAYNGWKISTDQLAEKRAETTPAPSAPSARDRMRAVRDAAAGQ
jgi:hypothetical protein